MPMIRLTPEQAPEVKTLFLDQNEMMLHCYFQGIAGQGHVDRWPEPQSARITVGDFCFLGGQPDAEFLDLPEKPSDSWPWLLIPHGSGWGELIQETLGTNCCHILRYSIQHLPLDAFDRFRLQRFAGQLPKDDQLISIDKTWYQALSETDWGADLCGQFPSYEAYCAFGLGVVAVREGVPVAGASSYVGCSQGIEIEIDTREDCRCQGLATACGAALILECLERGLYPSWDAHDLRSVALAEKLGYRCGQAYDTYLYPAPPKQP